MRTLFCIALVLISIATAKYLVTGQAEFVQSLSAPAPLATPAPAATPGATAMKPKTTPVPSSSTDESNDLYNSDGSLKRLPTGTKTQEYWGHIVQHLYDGRLLMQTNRGRIALTLPGKDPFVDGTYIPRFNGAVIGTYRYATTDGASRTVSDVLYIPAEAMPVTPTKPAATPGAWMWDKSRSTQLDRPASGARSKLTDQQRMAEWARQVQGSR